MSQVVIIKLPKGAPVPNGFDTVPVRETRSGDYYRKIVQVVSKVEVDELSDLFNQLGVNNVAIVPQSDENDFLNAFAGLSVGGKRTRTKKHRRSMKARKTKRRRN